MASAAKWNVQSITEKDTNIPYKKPLRVCVLVVDPKGAEQEPVRAIVGDESGAVKLVCYSQSKSKITKDSCFLLLNYTVYRQAIYIRENSKVAEIAKFRCPKEVRDKAENWTTAPVTPKSPIKEILTFKDHLTVSLSGTVTDIQPQTVVKAKGKDTTLRNVTINDETASVSVALWRQHSAINIAVGDELCLDNVTTSSFEGTCVVNTNYKSVCKKSPAKERKLNISFIGVEEENEDNFKLLTSSFTSYTVPTIMMKTIAINTENILEQLPLEVVLTLNGLTVTGLQLKNKE